MQYSSKKERGYSYSSLTQIDWDGADGYIVCCTSQKFSIDDNDIAYNHTLVVINWMNL